MKFKVGYIALCFALPAFVPQVYKLYNDNETKSFSSRTILLYSLAQFFWIIHAIIGKDYVLLTAASINLFCFTYIMYKMILNDDFGDVGDEIIIHI